MSLAKVTLQGSNHSFDCSSKESILHAGLAAGLNLKYGCDGGNCGDCIAQLRSGELSQLKHSDFVFSASQKQQNSFLMCCHSAIKDSIITASEHGSVDELAEQTIQAKVYKITRYSEHVLELALKTPRSQPLNFFAGQYVKLQLTNGLSRHKSLASCPCDGVKPSVHVQLREHDDFSHYIFNQLKKGEVVTIKGPYGHFTYNDDSQAPILLMAYETGLASIKSLIEHLVALDKTQPITLYHLHTPECDHYLGAYCRSLNDALDNFQYSLVCLKDNSLEQLQGAYEQIMNSHNELTQHEVYAALPRSFHAEAEAILLEKGLAQEQFKFDYLERI